MDEKKLHLTFTGFRAILPVLQELLVNMDESNGSISIDQKYLSCVPNNQVVQWAHFYEDSSLMNGIVARLLLGEERTSELNTEFKNTSPDSLEAISLAINEEVLEASTILINQCTDEDLSDSPDEIEPDDLTILTLTLPVFFNFQSVMTHGCFMSELVKRAKNGNEKAFYDAVQIDRTVLYSIPYFSNRLFRMQLSDDQDAKDSLATAIKGKIHGKDIKNPLLWFLLASLDDAGVLDVPLSTLLSFCKEQGIYGLEEKQDAETLRQVRKAYRKKAGVQI